MDKVTRQKKESALWNKMAGGYDARSLQTFQEAYRRSIEKACTVLSPSDQVLEIGCGTGILALGVAPCVASVTATDLSSAMIAVAREKAARQGMTNVTFDVHDGYALPYTDRSFDAVLLFNVIHFVQAPHRILQETHRLLKPGGTLITATDCYAEPVPWTTRLKLSLQRVLHWVGIIPFAWYYTRAELRRQFEENGFTVVEAQDLYADPVNHYLLAQKRTPT